MRFAETVLVFLLPATNGLRAFYYETVKKEREILKNFTISGYGPSIGGAV
jgi:hypothetical protein